MEVISPANAGRYRGDKRLGLRYRTKPGFTSTASGSRPCSAGRSRVAPRAAAIYTLPRSTRSPPRRRARLRARGFGVGKGFQMDDEARATGLDPAPDRAPATGPGGAGGRHIGIRARMTRRGQGGLDVSGPTYAALDLGTNNCRLLVARATRDGFRVIDAFSRIIRLGEGITSSGRLSEAAIVRAVEALRVCRAKMRNRGVTRARLIATEACRAAGNGLEFLERVRERGRHRARDRRPRDRGAARRHRLHAAGRSGGRGRDPVRHRRRLLGAGAARPLRADPARPAAPGDRRLGLDPDRRRDAGRAPRRRHGEPRDVRGDDRGGRGLRRPLRRRARRHSTACTCSAPRAR